ncbi:hypothetical protein AURDEDRAFT_159182 [Auricularia subglabra TFB-10046 SS5]|nr:hypothetical protein AURDEDRAFT_159182 [Auricularia subglabra TFB-10046 SS5]
MSVSAELLCGILGHDAKALYSVWDMDIFVDDEHRILRPELQTVNDLVAAIDKAHSYWCRCGIRLGPAVWRADLPIGEEADAALAWYIPHDDQLLDGTASLDTVGLSELPDDTIHLILGTAVPPVQLGSGLTSGLRRLGGDLCRVAGSHERILPETSHFPDIIRTGGCYFVERFDWILDTLGGEADVNTRIPIIRRPPGFGKSTFLSAYASYCELAIHEDLFPGPRAETWIIPRPLLVFFLDLSQLQLTDTMSDEEMHAECLRVMYAAAEAFHAQYAPLLGDDAPPFDRENTPTGNVKVLARKLGRQVFLAIDNYTTPFLHLEPTYERVADTPFFRIELAMRKFIVGYLLVAAGSGLIVRGLITGNSLPDEDNGALLPFEDGGGMFSEYTQDLTHELEAAHVIGFTRADVQELLRWYLCVPDERVVEVAARIVPVPRERRVDPETDTQSDGEATYAACDVLRALRDAQADS